MRVLSNPRFRTALPHPNLPKYRQNLTPKSRTKKKSHQLRILNKKKSLRAKQFKKKNRKPRKRLNKRKHHS